MHAQLTGQNASFIELQSGCTYFFVIPSALQINFNISRKNSVISCGFLWNQGKDFQHVENTPSLWLRHLSNATQNCLYLMHDQPLWTVLCDWQEILYPPHWDSCSPLIKSSWGKDQAAFGKGFGKNQPSEGVQSLLPELRADLCLSGETRQQRNNPLVLKVNEVDSSEPPQCFKFLEFYHSTVAFWSPFCAAAVADYIFIW